MDYISAELAATCDALGYFDGVDYHLSHEALNVIKDLIKYLKRDDDIHTVRRYLGQNKLLETDLIPILIHHSDNAELWDVLLRLLINLTSSAFIIYNEQLPSDKISRNYYLQLVHFLQSNKKSFADNRIWTLIGKRLEKLLKIEHLERGEENVLIIERILQLIHNVLQVPPNDNDTRVDNDATIHDQVLFTFHSSGIVDLLLYIASNRNEQQFHMQIMEIVALMLREQNPSKLATVDCEKSNTEKERDQAKLLNFRRKEMEEKVDKIKKYSSLRHSRFGGTYVVQNMKAIGDNQLICHKLCPKIEELDFSKNKRKVKKPKNRIAPEPVKEERVSAIGVRLFLKEFCVEFLIAAYNSVMRYIKSFIIGDTDAGNSHDLNYFWALRFFMEFNRHYKFQVKYVSETVSTELFYFTQRQMTTYYENYLMDKKNPFIWCKHLHWALKAYQELLHTLSAMDKSPDKGVRDSSKVIKSNVFYVPEYRETILSQLLSYDERKMSQSYLIDLVTTVHIFLKMLENFCGENRNILVAKKKKATRRKNVKKNKPKEPVIIPQKSSDELWDDVGPELSAVMRDGVIPEVTPFDVTSDTPVDDQKGEAMIRIQKLLRKKEFEQAIGLFRSSREVWPENDCFGSPDISVEEEFLALREIFFADLGVKEDEAEKVEEQNVENFLNHEGEIENDDDEDNEEEDGETNYEETNFDFKEFIMRFANFKIVKSLGNLLRSFNEHTPEVNHYILKLLHRIAWDCKMHVMIFQASIFRTFQQIFNSKNPQHKELKKFAVFIIRRFIEVAEKNRKVYMELLFWKNTHLAVEIEGGYDVAVENKKVSRNIWSEAEEEELRTLFMEHQTNKYPQDLIDWLLDNIINENRTSRGIMKKLKEMDLIVNSKAVRNAEQRRAPKEWAEEEITQLRELWGTSKNSEDPIDTIYEGLNIKRPKTKIKEKLLELGLAKDKKELHKKRKKKNNGSSKSNQRYSSSDVNSADDESNPRNVVKNKKFTKKRKQKSQIFSDIQRCNLLKAVIEEDMKEAVEWVKESIEDALEDLDEESIEGIPLVPIEDYSLDAMDSSTFKKFLTSIGIEQPSDEQQAYWRIPSTMLKSTMEKYCNLIKQGLDGNFISENSTAVDTINSDRTDSDSSSDDEGTSQTTQDLEKVKKMFNKKKPSKVGKEKFESIPIDNSRSGGSSDDDEGNTNDKAEQELEVTVPIIDLNSSTDNQKKTTRIKSISISSDSEGQEEQVQNTNENEETKRILSDNSDGETPARKKRRIIGSDDEDDSTENKNNSEVHNSKQSRRILSDDED